MIDCNEFDRLLHNDDVMAFIRSPSNNISNRIYNNDTNVLNIDNDRLALLMNLYFLGLVFPKKNNYTLVDTWLSMMMLSMIT